MGSDQLPVYTREYIETLVSVSRDAVVFLDKNFSIQVANQQFYESFGSHKEKDKSLPSLDAVAGLSGLKVVLEELSSAHPVVQRSEILLKAASGGEELFSVSVFLVLADDSNIGTLYFVTLENHARAGEILTAVCAEEAKMALARMRELESSKSFLDAILNSAYYGIASYEPLRNAAGKVVDFRVAYSNAEVPGNFGLTVDQILNKKCSEIYPGIFENGVFDKMAGVLKTGVADTYEISVPVNGKTIWLTAAIEKVNDWLTVTSKNITPEKEAALHLEKMNQLLAENEAQLELKNNKLQGQNEELASFNYIASHDLQEPLRKIRMFSSRILEREQEHLSEASIGLFGNITHTAERMQNLINDLLEYSGMDAEPVEMRRTDLNVVLQEVLATMEDTFEQQGVTFSMEALPVIQGIPQQLHQLFSNIIMNAVKYSKNDVKPVIALACEQVAMPGGLFYKIAVSDNGIGFEPEYKDRIFEVFQRLHGKNEYGGTGVGLAICKKIMQYHHGFITGNGEPDKGAVFAMYFPVGE